MRLMRWASGLEKNKERLDGFDIRYWKMNVL